MTEVQALELVRQLLRAPDDDALMHLVSRSLPLIDGAFFKVAEASAQQLEREEKLSAARALRGLSDRMLRMKTLI